MFHAHLPPLHLSRDIPHPQVNESSCSMNPSKPTRRDAFRTTPGAPGWDDVKKRFTDGHWKEETDTCIYYMTIYLHTVCIYIYTILYMYTHIYRVYVCISYRI